MENLQNLPLDAAISKLIDLIVSFGSRLLIAIIVFFVGRWIIRRIINVVVKAMQRRKVEASLFSFVRSMVKITLYFLFIIILIGILGIETSSFIALFASAGIAIGAAMSGTLQNFAGGVGFQWSGIVFSSLGGGENSRDSFGSSFHSQI